MYEINKSTVKLDIMGRHWEMFVKDPHSLNRDHPPTLKITLNFFYFLFRILGFIWFDIAGDNRERGKSGFSTLALVV